MPQENNKPKSFEDTKKENTIETGNVKIEGKDYKYRVCRQQMQPDLPDFVGFNGTEFFISDSVPEEYRKYIFIHEAVCIPKMGQHDHCVNAVEYELANVPLPDKLEYIIFRRNFFQGLVEFFNKRATDRNVQFRAELQKSLDYLGDQLKK